VRETIYKNSTALLPPKHGNVAVASKSIWYFYRPIPHGLVCNSLFPMFWW
jgi:hypothetical protein